MSLQYAEVSEAKAERGPVMALESEVSYLTQATEDIERISNNIAGNGPQRETSAKLSSAPQPVLSISQRIAAAAGNIGALRDRINDAMSRIEQAL